MSGYSYFLAQRVFEFWQSQPASARRLLSDQFDRLAGDPFGEGDGAGENADGLREFYTLCGPFLITHRTDHAVRRVLITDVIRD